MTGRLIDADALYTLFVKMKSFGELTAKKAIRCVEEAPTVDAEPVRHGKWIDYTDEGYVECDQCHSATNCDGDIEELNYCWHCGARMHKRKKNE